MISSSFNSFSLNHSSIANVTGHYLKLTPLALPYLDQEGRQIHLYAYDHTKLLGLVIDKSRKMIVLKDEAIFSALHVQETNLNLIERLKGSPLKRWDFVFDINRLILTIWPQIKAEGRYDGMKLEEVLDNLSQRYQKLKEGALNAQHYNAYRLENQGKKVRDANGKVIINPKTNKPFDHVHEVKLYQMGARNLIKDIKTLLANRSCNEAERAKLIKALSQASCLLDESKKYTQSNPKKRVCPQLMFRQCLQQTRLTSSYNSMHRSNPMPERGEQTGEIGGVACGVDYLQGLFDDEDGLWVHEHFFCLPTGFNDSLPFSDLQLRQILRELAIGVYVHEAFPFFSLHFEQKQSNLFPVLHPIYEKTLVGRIIGMLDYFMKGYLNGGIYTEEFIDQWHQSAKSRASSLNAVDQLLSFQEYCQTHLEGADKAYFSLHQLSQILEKKELMTDLASALADFVNPQDKIINDHEGFQASFRIITEQKPSEKEDNFILIHDGFKVLYTITPSEYYNRALQRYRERYGCYPAAYQNLLTSYKCFCERIHDHMAKLPLFRPYFSMLKLVSFFSAYFATLKQYRKVPVLPTLMTHGSQVCPSLFPFLPVAHAQEVLLKIDLQNSLRRSFFEHKALFYKIFDEAFKSAMIFTESTKRQEVCLQSLKKGADGLTEALFVELKREALKNAPRPLRQVMGKTDEVDKSLMNIAQTSIEALFGRYLKLWENFSQAHPNIALESEEKIQQAVSLIYEKMADLPSVKTLDLKFMLDTTYLPSEISDYTKNQVRRIVGGCGVNLTEQPLHQSDEARHLFYKYWSQIDALSPETLKQIQLKDGNLGVVFRLPLQDVPADREDDYVWMEHMLFAQNEEEMEKLAKRLELESMLKQNDAFRFEELLRQDPDQSFWADRSGRTLVHLAAQEANSFYLNTLLKISKEGDVQDIYGFRPLHYAAVEGCIANAVLLIKKDPAVLNASAKSGATPLTMAILNKQAKMVEYLLGLQPLPANLVTGYTDLHCALNTGDPEISMLILNNRPLAESCLNENSLEGGTPLMLACEMKLYSCIERLLQLRAHPHLRRFDGLTALEIAILLNDLTSMSLLAKVSEFRDLTIEILVRKGSVEMLRWVNQRTDRLLTYRGLDRSTSLQQALMEANLNTAACLISLGVDPHVINDRDETAFDQALKLNAWEIVKLLYAKQPQIRPRLVVSAKYDPFSEIILRNLNVTPLELKELALDAAKAGNYAVLNRFFSKEVSLDQIQDSDSKWTLLHYLAKGDEPILFVKLLSKRKVALFELDRQGKSLPYVAAENGSKKILQLILPMLKEKGLERHFKDRHLFYGVLESKNQACIEMMLEDFPDLIDAVLDDKGTRAVHLAAKQGLEFLMELFRSKNISFSRLDNDKKTPLYYALRSSQLEMIANFIENKIPWDAESLLLVARTSQNYDSRFLKQISFSELSFIEALEKAVSVNDASACVFLMKDAYQNLSRKVASSLIRKAVSRGHLAVLKLLLVPGIPQKALNEFLLLACERGFVECVKILMAFDYPVEVLLAAQEFAKSYPLIQLLVQRQDQQFQGLVVNFEKALNDLELEKLQLFFSIINLGNFSLNADSGYQGTVLHHLAKHSTNSAIYELIKVALQGNPVFMSLRDSDGNTVFHLCLKKNHLLPNLNASFFEIANNEGELPIHLAAAHADLETFEKVLEKSLDFVDFQNKEGRTPLFYAFANDLHKKNIIPLLIKKGADVNLSDHNLINPLFLACEKQDLEWIQRWLELGADPNLAGPRNKYLLQKAIEEDNPVIAKPLLIYGAKMELFTIEGQHPLHYAIKSGNLPFYRLLSCFLPAENIRNSSNQLLQHQAAFHGQIEILADLERKGFLMDEPLRSADKKIATQAKKAFQAEGARPIHFATMNNQIHTVQWLIDRKVELGGHVRSELPLLQLAVLVNSKSVLQLFSQYRFSKDLENIHQAAASAIVNDQIQVVSSFYENQLTLHSKIIGDKNGLQLASESGALHTTSYFLQRGADPYAKDGEGKNAFEIAASNSSVEQFKFLIEYCTPNINETNDHGQTLLHHACQANNLKHVLFLIMKEAQLEAADHRGLKSLNIAIRNQNSDLLHLLLVLGADPQSVKLSDFQSVKDLEVKDRMRHLLNLFTAFRQQGLENRLHQAIKSSHAFGLPYLLQVEAIDEQDSQGFTALHHAVMTGQEKVVFKLLRAGVKNDLPDSQGRTPLWHACFQGNFLMAKMLLKDGADPMQKDATGVSILEQLSMSHPDYHKKILKITKKYNPL